MKSYEKHIKVCTGPCIYNCKYCSKTFDSDGILKQHINNVHENGRTMFNKIVIYKFVNIIIKK